jgi:hypothetical protein
MYIQGEVTSKSNNMYNEKYNTNAVTPLLVTPGGVE